MRMKAQQSEDENMSELRLAANARPNFLALATVVAFSGAVSAAPPNAENNVYFGAVHVHTSWSFDGFTNGSKTTPLDAYAWAQGKPITGSGGPDIQIKTPLDFYMVSEHAEFMGVFNQMANPDSPLSKNELAKGVTSPDPATRMATFTNILRDMSAGKRDPRPAACDALLARQNHAVYAGGGRRGACEMTTGVRDAKKVVTCKIKRAFLGCEFIEFLPFSL